MKRLFNLFSGLSRTRKSVRRAAKRAIPAQLQLFESSRTNACPVTPQPIAINLEEEWTALRREYFPERTDLDNYSVRWSNRRQKRTLGSCNVERKRIVIAHAFHQQEMKIYLRPLLYHEMCHAALGKPEVINGRRSIHNREFKLLERRHPGIKALDAWIRSGGWRTTEQRHNRARRKKSI